MSPRRDDASDGWIVSLRARCQRIPAKPAKFAIERRSARSTIHRSNCSGKSAFRSRRRMRCCRHQSIGPGFACIAGTRPNQHRDPEPTSSGQKNHVDEVFYAFSALTSSPRDCGRDPSTTRSREAADPRRSKRELLVRFPLPKFAVSR